jgi:8-oxo-dGTP pyrophosphatase MutT (NUDIX family)
MRKLSPPERWSLAFYVLIRDPRGRVLLLRRSAASGRFPGCWELPGGKAEGGESPADAAAREVLEETGLRVVPMRVLGASEGSVADLRIAMLFFASRARKTRIALSNEHDAFRWLPLAKVSTLKLRPGFDSFLDSQSRIRRSRTKPGSSAGPA